MIKDCSLRIKECTRDQPHGGPCNGWPCPHARKLLIEREHADSIEEQPVTPYSRYRENREID
jgi:hypothetical protein